MQTLDWIQTRQVANHIMVETLWQEIDEGEAEAIALAIELNAELLINDRTGFHYLLSRSKSAITGSNL